PSCQTMNATSGAISGTPTTAGTSNFTVQVIDSSSGKASKAFTLTINSTAPPLSITTASPLPSGTVGTVYSQTLAATGGTAPYAWSVISGSLPAGLTLNATSGAISGTPTTAGTSNFTVQVIDSSSGKASKAFTLTINSTVPPLSITTASPLPSGTVGTVYSQTRAAARGAAPYGWSVISGSLPAGLTLNATSGAISGTPTTAGTSNFTVQVIDSSSGKASKAFTPTINSTAPPLSITTASPLPSGTVGTLYSQT